LGFWEKIASYVWQQSDLANVLAADYWNRTQDYPTLMHSLLGLCIPFALLPTFSTKHELVHFLRLSRLTRVFVTPSRLSAVLEAAKEVGLPSNRIHAFGTDKGGRVRGRASLQGLVERVRKDRTPHVPIKPARKDTIAYLVFSSGTTGLPKAVIITQENLAFVTMQVTTVHDFAEENNSVNTCLFLHNAFILTCFLPLSTA
jgi:acyl-CoA synthetase (AMP-forming)/AMP-acid ligase II